MHCFVIVNGRLEDLRSLEINIQEVVMINEDKFQHHPYHHPHVNFKNLNNIFTCLGDTEGTVLGIYVAASLNPSKK